MERESVIDPDAPGPQTADGAGQDYIPDFSPRVAEARLLPADEEWRSATWAHFRYRVLCHLRDAGARSLAEIEAEGPTILFLPLNRTELAAVVELARRHGLVAPLKHLEAADGSRLETEWRITSRGRQAVRSPFAWAMAQLGVGLRVIPILAAIATVSGLSAVLARQLTQLELWQVVVIAFVVAYVLYFAVLGLATHWSRRSGAGQRLRVAEDWQRFQRERPQWYEAMTTKFPLRWTIASVVVGAIAFAIALLADGGLPQTIGFAVFGATLVVLYALFFRWLLRRNRWAGEEEKRLEGLRQSARRR